MNVHTHAQTHIYEYLLSLYSVLVCVFLGPTIWFWKISWRALHPGGLIFPLSTLQSCLQFECLSVRKVPQPLEQVPFISIFSDLQNFHLIKTTRVQSSTSLSSQGTISHLVLPSYIVGKEMEHGSKQRICMCVFVIVHDRQSAFRPWQCDKGKGISPYSCFPS